jgi:S-adenosylmethionine decarboxylase
MGVEDVENSSAYTVGKMNGDHWLLYLTPPQDDVLRPHALASSSALPASLPTTELSTLTASLSSASLHTLDSSRSGSLYTPTRSKNSRPTRPDQTLEILMSRLDSSACASFYHPSSSSTTPYVTPLYASSPEDSDAHTLGAALSESLGLAALLPNATIDSYLFSPCGFSSNAIQGDRYATIHVTPEEEHSYASYETNLAFDGQEEGGAEGGPKDLKELVERVLGIFRPGRISMTLFVSMDDEDEDEEGGRGRKKAHKGMGELMESVREERYKVVDSILYEFEGYSLVFISLVARS